MLSKYELRMRFLGLDKEYHPVSAAVQYRCRVLQPSSARGNGRKIQAFEMHLSEIVLKDYCYLHHKSGKTNVQTLYTTVG